MTNNESGAEPGSSEGPISLEPQEAQRLLVRAVIKGLRFGFGVYLILVLFVAGVMLLQFIVGSAYDRSSILTPNSESGLVPKLESELTANLEAESPDDSDSDSSYFWFLAIIVIFLAFMYDMSKSGAWAYYRKLSPVEEERRRKTKAKGLDENEHRELQRIMNKVRSSGRGGY